MGRSGEIGVRDFSANDCPERNVVLDLKCGQASMASGGGEYLYHKLPDMILGEVMLTFDNPYQMPSRMHGASGYMWHFRSFAPCPGGKAVMKLFNCLPAPGSQYIRCIMEPAGGDVGDMLRVMLYEPDPRVYYAALLPEPELGPEYLGDKLAVSACFRYDELDNWPFTTLLLIQSIPLFKHALACEMDHTAYLVEPFRGWYAMQKIFRAAMHVQKVLNNPGVVPEGGQVRSLGSNR